MAEEPRFDWPAMLRVTGIVVAITAVYGFAIPLAVSFITGQPDTRRAAGYELYQWGFWAIAWALIIWQSSWMLRTVGEKIIDDMLVTSAIVAILLVVVRIVIALVYEPITKNGDLYPLVTSIDAGGALILIVVALIGSRANRY